jgi:hypothetical protein
MNRWAVRDVPDDTIAAIKQLTVDRGCKVSEVLAQEFGGNVKLYKTDSWTIYNVPESTKAEIKARAKKLNKPIGYLLEELVSQKSEKEVEKELRIQLVNQMRLFLKEFRKLD